MSKIDPTYGPNPRVKIFQGKIKDQSITPIEKEIQEFSDKVNVFDFKFQVSGDYIFCFMLYYTLQDLKDYNSIIYTEISKSGRLSD